MAIEHKIGICRICTAFCPIDVTVDNGIPIRVVGDRESEVFGGYTCVKGRSLPSTNNRSDRLLTSLKRMPDGSFEPIRLSDAIAEIADKVQSIIDTHGPRAIATYLGTHSAAQAGLANVGMAFMAAIGSPMQFSAMTLDQPGDWIARANHGTWIGGEYEFESSDTWLLVGTNPIVSHQYFAANPVGHITSAVRRGCRLLVIDPRVTETARHAHLHLQPRPGHDAIILAGLLHLLIDRQQIDDAFVTENVQNFGRLKEELAAFTPDVVCRRSGIARADLEAAADIMGTSRRGGVYCGTGASMSSMGGNLVYYLGLVMHSLRGWWAREGDPLLRPNVLLPPITARAEPRSPSIGRYRYTTNPMRVRGLSAGMTGAPSGALAEEILMEGPGKIRVLFNMGGNPLMALPDADQARRALESLDLYVTTDVSLSANAKAAHYVIAAKTTLESPMSTQMSEVNKYFLRGKGYEQPYAHYVPAVVEPPSGSEVVDDWQLYYRLAQQLGLELTLINVAGIPGDLDVPPTRHVLNMAEEPTTDQLIDIICQGSRVPISVVRDRVHGHTYEQGRCLVLGRRPACEQFLDVGSDYMMGELRASLSPESIDDAPYVLIPRRAKRFMNSSGQDVSRLLGETAINPLWMNPTDINSSGLAVGSPAVVRSRHGEVWSVIEADDTLRQGVVAMAHGFGPLRTGGHDNPADGVSTNALLSTSEEFDSITGMPRMGAVPVYVSRSENSAD